MHLFSQRAPLPRMPRPTLRAALVTTLFASVGASGLSFAQDKFPARAITLVVPFAAGSGTDVGTRALGKTITETLGVPVVIDNKPGANGAIGAQAVARAKPDGYTLLVGSATTNAANFAFYAGKLGYEPASFEMVAGMTGSALALHVAAGSPWKSVPELIAAGKAGKLACGSGNAVTQVACEIFKRQGGFDAVTVPYKSNPQSLTDVIGGQIQYAFSDTAASQPLVQGKQVRIIGIAGPERSAIAPDARTFGEQGMPKFLFTAWIGLFAPAGTPEPILTTLNGTVNRWLDSADGRALRERTGSFALRFTRTEARQFIQAEISRWDSYIKDSNVRPE